MERGKQDVLVRPDTLALSRPIVPRAPRSIRGDRDIPAFARATGRVETMPSLDLDDSEPPPEATQPAPNCMAETVRKGVALGHMPADGAPTGSANSTGHVEAPANGHNTRSQPQPNRRLLPPPETGVHGWLFGRAVYLRREGLPLDAARGELLSHIASSAFRPGRRVTDREVEEAIAGAYGVRLALGPRRSQGIMTRWPAGRSKCTRPRENP